MLSLKTHASNFNLKLCVFKVTKKSFIYFYKMASNYYLIIQQSSIKFDFFNLNPFDKIIQKPKYILTWNCFLVFKIFRVVFRGKGFRVKIFRKKKKITLNFGHSHWTKLKFYKSWYFFKLRRQNYIFFSHNLYDLDFFYKTISTIRILNRYTQRGLRLKKQEIKRRFGKISQYISSLH